jgi:hypothetical protein
VDKIENGQLGAADDDSLIAILCKQSANIYLSVVKLRCWVMELHLIILVAISFWSKRYDG